MVDLPTERLIELNQWGIIPGPDETTSAFLKRADYCLNLDHATYLPLKGKAEDKTSLEKPCQETKELFDMAPCWIPIFFNNYQLFPWHGGCAWIFQMTDDSPLGAFIQLRQAFRHSPTHLGIYHRDELMSHELAHVGRMAFEEPKFEEFFAYRTSPSPFRRWFGPIVRSSTESMLFVVLLFLILIIDLGLLFGGSLAAFQSAMWLKLIPCLLIAFALFRLWFFHDRLNRCEQNLTRLLGSKRKAKRLAYRLTDQEILEFSRMTPDQIAAYAQAHAANSLRWKLIHSAYLE